MFNLYLRSITLVRNITRSYSCRYYLFILACLPIGAVADITIDQNDYPDITGTWVSKEVANSASVSKYEFTQDKQLISGRYSDEQNGKLVLESPINGFIDKQGNIIFDLYFGKVTATNRLKLSPDGKVLEGTFSTTMGNEGDVAE